MSQTATTDYASSPLFTGVSLGGIELSNRVVMAPLTRVRAGSTGVPIAVHLHGAPAAPHSNALRH